MWGKGVNDDEEKNFENVWVIFAFHFEKILEFDLNTDEDFLVNEDLSRRNIERLMCIAYNDKSIDFWCRLNKFIIISYTEL